MESQKLELGLRIRDEIKKRKLTFKKTAEQAGISTTGLRSIINGRRRPSLGTLESLSEVFGITPYELLRPGSLFREPLSNQHEDDIEVLVSLAKCLDSNVRKNLIKVAETLVMNQASKQQNQS